MIAKYHVLHGKWLPHMDNSAAHPSDKRCLRQVQVEHPDVDGDGAQLDRLHGQWASMTSTQRELDWQGRSCREWAEDFQSSHASVVTGSALRQQEVGICL